MMLLLSVTDVEKVFFTTDVENANTFTILEW